jgi:hypothetical protein
MNLIPIPDAAAQIALRPVPLLLLDNCNLLDLLRAPVRDFVDEIEAAIRLRDSLRTTTPGIWLSVAEFIPLEWAANAGAVFTEQES